MDPINIKQTVDHELLKFDEKIDHTQNEMKENLQQMVSHPSDDFEHVEHELLPNLMASSTAAGHDLIDPIVDLTKSTINQTNKFYINEGPREVIDFVTKSVEDKKLDDLHSTNKNMTILNDFMDFERQQQHHAPVAPKTPSPTRSTKAEIEVDNSTTSSNKNNEIVEDDYLNPYSLKTKNVNEINISSEDLIEPIKTTIDNIIKKTDVSPIPTPTPAPITTKITEPTITSNENIFPVDNLLNDFDLDKDLPSFNSIKNDVHVTDKFPVVQDEPAILIKEKEQPQPLKVETEQKKSIIPTTPIVEVTNLKSKEMISAEEMFCRIGLDAWFKPERLHPKVESLVYWRDTKKSGIVFGVGLALLLAMSCFSLISVFAYVSLLGLVGTVSFRIYKNILQAVQKTSEGHPFKEYFELDLTLSQEKVQDCVNVSVAHINAFTSELRRLFLVEDLVDSVKFGLMLWCLTYLGAWFNGMTLVILVFVALFTLPKVYENNKQSIDTYLDLVRSKILEITDKVKAAIPIGKKVDTEKDK